MDDAVRKSAARRVKPAQSRLLLLLPAAALSVVALIIWYTLFRSHPPDYEQAVVMPGMGRHLVNLWITPRKDGTGLADIRGQVTDGAGMAIRADLVEFVMASGNGQTSTSSGLYSPSWGDRAHVFTASVQYPAAGTRLIVRFNMGSTRGEAVFEPGYRP